MNRVSLFHQKRWSPVAVGVGIALLGLTTIYFFGQTIGVSSSFERTAVLFYHLLFSDYLQSTGYQVVTPLINWQSAFVVGIFVGAWISAQWAGYKAERIPSVWQANFGDRWWTRATGAFVGGVIIMIGARIARGCTSGHAITGGMHLATAGWLFMIALFAAGIVTAHILYRKGR